MKYLSILFLALVLSLQSFAQRDKIIDFAKTDITKASPFDAKAVSVFGTRLAMSKKDAIEALNADHSLVWEFDGFNTPSEDVNSNTEMRIYVYTKNESTGGKDKSLLYLIWNKDSDGLDRIVFYNDMMPMAVGDTKKLLSKDAITPGSAFYKRFLVKMDKEDNGSYTIKQYYFSNKLVIIQVKDSDTPNNIYFSLDR